MVDATVSVAVAVAVVVVLLTAALSNCKFGLLSGLEPKLNVLPLDEPNENF